MDRDSLRLLLAQGLSLEEIGRRFRRDPSTIGYWVRKHGLVATNRDKHAPRGRRRQLAQHAQAAGKAIVQLECRHHGQTDFWLDGRGYYRCLRCRQEAVGRRRRKVKKLLVEEMGGG